MSWSRTRSVVPPWTVSTAGRNVASSPPKQPPPSTRLESRTPLTVTLPRPPLVSVTRARGELLQLICLPSWGDVTDAERSARVAGGSVVIGAEVGGGGAATLPPPPHPGAPATRATRASDRIRTRAPISHTSRRTSSGTDRRDHTFA